MKRLVSIGRTPRILSVPTAALAFVCALLGAATPVLAQTAPPPPVRPVEGGPALWVIRDADSTIYLFGTVHVLRRDTVWRSDRVEAAFTESSDLWLEIENPDDQAAAMPVVQQYGLDFTTPLSSLLTAEEQADLDTAARAAGLSAAQLQPFRPWLAGVTLSVAPLVRAGFDPRSGVELSLKPRAEAAGKTVHGFETVDEQIRMLATLPAPVQLEFLRSTLKDFDEAPVELGRMVEAWSRGDVETLDRITVEEMKTEAPEVYDALLVRRNAGFARQIQAILAGSGIAFVAVGAAHLAGGDSVQAQLQSQGLSVTRVQ